MPVTGTVTQFMMNLGTQLPQLIVCIVGAVLAASYWQRDPRTSLLILLACLLSIFQTVAFGLLYAFLPMLMGGGTSHSGLDMRSIYMVLGIFRSCVIAAAWVLVLVAVFRRRPAA